VGVMKEDIGSLQIEMNIDKVRVRPSSGSLAKILVSKNSPSISIFKRNIKIKVLALVKRL